MSDPELHELKIEFTEWKTQQKHIMSKVDVSDVKKAIFQAKWMLVGGVVFAGLMNSPVLVDILSSVGK